MERGVIHRGGAENTEEAQREDKISAPLRELRASAVSLSCPKLKDEDPDRRI
jgi:hypothetical protein